MSKAKKKEAISPITALIDTPVIGGYEIKEWSIRQFSLLYPYLKQVISSIQLQGATMENAEEFLKDNMAALVDAFIPVLPEVLELSLNLTPEEVDKIPAGQASLIGLAIIKKNTENLTNFLAEIKGSLRETDQAQTTP